jgi:FKBP-type peptidyl-prolyl cis-trans isomerase
MGRRKRCDDDDYDDSVERAYSGEAPKEASQESAKEKSADEIERMRLKKKAKKEIQKQKKDVAQKKEAKLREAKRKQNEEVEKLRQEVKKRKVIEKTKPASKSFVGTQKGVKYCDILLGKGPLIEAGKKVQVKYVLRAEHKQGKVLDSGENFSFRLGKGDVISGWDIGLLGMKEGGIRHLIVPPKAGYGSKDIGGGPRALLYFEVTLLQC